MDYRQWLQTMYCNFGEKWIRLHRGPMWCATSAEQDLQGASGRVVCKQRTMELWKYSVATIVCVYGTCTGSSQCTSNF